MASLSNTVKPYVKKKKNAKIKAKREITPSGVTSTLWAELYIDQYN